MPQPAASSVTANGTSDGRSQFRTAAPSATIPNTCGLEQRNRHPAARADQASAAGFAGDADGGILDHPVAHDEAVAERGKRHDSEADCLAQGGAVERPVHAAQCARECFGPKAHPCNSGGVRSPPLKGEGRGWGQPHARTIVRTSRVTENLLNVIAAKTGELNTAAARSTPKVTPTPPPPSGGGSAPPALRQKRSRPQPQSVNRQLLAAFVHRRLTDPAGAGDGGAEARGLRSVGDRACDQAVFDAAARLFAVDHQWPQRLQQRAMLAHRAGPDQAQRGLGWRAAEIEMNRCRSHRGLLGPGLRLRRRGVLRVDGAGDLFSAGGVAAVGGARKSRRRGNGGLRRKRGRRGSGGR